MTTTMPEDDRLTAAVRLNLTPGELAELKKMAEDEDRPLSFVVRRAVREMLDRRREVA